MICKECGAKISPDEQFCPECGAKVIRKKRCPECGELVRVGIKFCPHCGAEMGGARPAKKSSSDAPAKKRTDSGSAARKRTDADAVPRKKANPAPPPKKKSVYRDEPPRRRRDWEDDDWDDDDDDEEESVDFLTIMTVAVGCVLLVIVAVLGYNLYQRYVPKNYERAAEQQQEEQEQEEQDGEEEGDGEEGGQALEEEQEDEADDVEEPVGGTLVTIADVNIRDNPSTQGTTVIRKAKSGDEYEYIEAVEGGSWYKIVLHEDGYDYGYVSADYIEIP